MSALVGRYLRPHWPRILVLVGLLLIDAGSQLALPRFLTVFVDSATSATTTYLTGLALGYLAVSIFGQLATAIQAYVAADVGMRATNRLRTDLLQHTLSLDMAWHNATTPGALIERIDGDTSRLNAMMSKLLPQLSVNVLTMSGALVAFYLIDWRTGVLVSVLLPLALIFLNRIQKRIQAAYGDEREYASRLFGLIEERLAGTEDVRANGAVAHVLRRFFDASGDWGRRSIRANVLGSLPWAIPSGISAVISVLVVALGVWLVGAGELTLGAVVALLRYSDVLSRPWFQLGRNIQELIETFAAFRRIDDLTRLSPTVIDRGTQSLPAGAIDLQLEDVSFGYADGTDAVLNHVGFELGRGRVLGLLGRTGSGKTTLTRILARLYDLTTGSVKLAGVAVDRIPLATLRERITLVTQDVQIFSASVRDNLTMYDGSIPDDRIWHALDLVGLKAWGLGQPQQLETQLIGGGTALSAGEAQLLALARAFMRDPGLVIMDEASSRLDPATEQQLERAVDLLLAGRTAIIIAHRLRTVERADDILVLDDGRIVEHGDRATLAGDPSSRYFALLNHDSGMEDLLA